MSEEVVFCRACRRHYDEDRRFCPVDGEPLLPPTSHIPPYGSMIDDRYARLEAIGIGGMSHVFRAFDTEMRREVALKVVKPTVAIARGGVERFFREVRALRRLQHPNIVAVWGSGRTEDGVLYLVSELLNGTCLSDLVQRENGLPVPDALGIAMQVAAALDAAHRAKILHRDLKPENFRVLPGNLVKLLDFGIAALWRSDGDDDVVDGDPVCGTPHYMSPEQALGEPCTAQSDLYGLGVLLFELLTGRPPYDHPEPVSVIRMHLMDPVPALSKVRPECAEYEGIEGLVNHLLQKRANNRPRNAISVLHRLQQLQERAVARFREVGAKLNYAIPFHERPTLLLEEGEPHERRTLPEMSGQQDVTEAFPLIYCSACRYLCEKDAVSCSHCFAPLSLEPPPAATKRAQRLLAAIIGPDPRYHKDSKQSYTGIDVDLSEKPVKYGLSLVHLSVDYSKDAEDDRMQPLIEVLADWRGRIAETGGVVCRDAGSSVRAVWGLDGAVGSEPALRCALILREMLRKLRKSGWDCAFRLGVTTGEVYLDSAALASLDWGLEGSVVDVATRLVTLAQPGQVLCDAATVGAISSGVRCQRAAIIQVRGKEQPEDVFNVLSLKKGVSRAAGQTRKHHAADQEPRMLYIGGAYPVGM